MSNDNLGLFENTQSLEERLSTKFNKKRESISSEIHAGVKQMVDIKRLAMLQVDFLSMRQRLLEDNHQLIEVYSGIRRKYKEKIGEEWEKLNNSQRLHTPTEKKTIIENKQTKLMETIDLFENQIKFYESSIKTVDNVLYGLKTRIDIEKLIGTS